MTNVKVSLSIILPGGVMFSKEESLKQLEKPVRNKAGKVILKKGKPITKTVVVPDFEKHESFSLTLKERGHAPEQVKVFVRKSKPARQVINLTEEAYKYMVSREQPAEFKGSWNTLSINQKLKWHCNKIAQGVGGTLESYQILD